MSKDRSVTTDALATLGTIIDDAQKRDAIHLAVEPVLAGESLDPGDHVRIAHGLAIATHSGKGHGIVDPFLVDEVEKGQRFWFIMYPRQITSLRHVWAHPLFPDEPGTPAPVRSDVEISTSWLRQYAARVNHYLEPEAAYVRLLDDIKNKAIVYQGTDMHDLSDLQDAGELQHHAQIVLGQPVRWEEFEYFSCTC